jgi:2-iminobutanoate/2-iminopropanoate deaminase
MKEIIKSEKAPTPIGPYSHAVKAGNFIFLSGQVGVNPETGELVKGDIKKEAAQVMENLQSVLVAAGADFSNVVKTSIFLSDMSYFADVNEVYGSYFTGNYPARETVAVKTLPRNANVEISMIVMK